MAKFSFRNNPNDRRRLNRLGRSPASQARTAAKKALRLKFKGDRSGYEAAAKAQGIATGAALRELLKSLPEQSAADRKINRQRHVVAARTMASQPGYGGVRTFMKWNAKKGRFVRTKKTGYAAAVLAPKHLRYYYGKKRTGASQTIPMGKGHKGKGKVRVVNAMNIEAVRAYNAGRVSHRKGSEWFDPTSRSWSPNMKVGSRQETYEANYPDGPYKASGAVLARLRGGKSARANPIWQRAVSNQGGSALVPYGALALTNPQVGVKGYFIGYALPIVVGGLAAGGIHAALAGYGVTSMISDTVAKIPVIGEPIATYAPFTTQGLILGSVSSLVIGSTGLATGRGGMAGQVALLVAGSAIVGGAVMDMFSYVTGRQEAASAGSAEADLGDDIDKELEGLAGMAGLGGIGALAFTNQGGLGDLAFSRKNVSALGDLALTNLGDGFAYEIRSLNGSPGSLGDYGQASLADAQYCGVDFSVPEGQALLNGRTSYQQTFGAPPFRSSSRDSSSASHLAGRDGHRWGWLIKAVGWDKAQLICRLPPGQRIPVLKKMRQAAVDTFHQELQAAGVSTVQSPSAGIAPHGAVGQHGIPSQLDSGSDIFGNPLGDPALFSA